MMPPLNKSAPLRSSSSNCDTAVEDENATALLSRGGTPQEIVTGLTQLVLLTLDHRTSATMGESIDIPATRTRKSQHGYREG